MKSLTQFIVSSITLVVMLETTWGQTQVSVPRSPSAGGAAEIESPYRLQLRRTAIAAEQKEHSDYLAYTEFLIRATSSVQARSKQSRSEAIREQADIDEALKLWQKRPAEQQAAAEKGRGKQPPPFVESWRRKVGDRRSTVGSDPKRVVINTRSYLPFEQYFHAVTQYSGLTDTLSYASAIRIPGFHKEFSDYFNKGVQQISELLEKQKDDACYELYNVIATGFWPPNDESQIDDAVKACMAAMQSRGEFHKNYFDLMDASLVAVVASLTKAQSSITEKLSISQKSLESLAELETRADKEYASRDRTIIDESAIWIICTTLVAWMLIIGIVVGAIILMGRGANQPFNYTLFLEMMTVFILTATILILGLAGKLQNEALAALIGGISGYVLGRIHSSPRGV